MKRSFQFRPIKVKAFTIVEVIVTLILISFIFSISIVVYRMVLNQQKRYLKTINAEMEHLTLSNALESDMLRSAYIMVDKDGVVFFLNENSKLKYSLTDSLLIRKNEHSVRDTFHLKGLQVGFYFEDANVSDTGKLVDRINLDFYQGDLKSTIFVKKNYDASTLVKLNY